MTADSRRRGLAVAAPLALAAALVAIAGGSDATAGRTQTTTLISRSLTGGIPNGASTNAVISNDKRYARVIAFESEASDLVEDDTNDQTDVFMIRRAGEPVDNEGSVWRPGPTTLVSRTYNGAPANGPSFAPAVAGGFGYTPPKCLAFLSGASNLVRRDTNGRIDAFLVRRLGSKPRRLRLPGGRQPTQDSTFVAVSGDCSRVAFVSGGRLYVKARRRTRRLGTAHNPQDPSFAGGRLSHLVFGAEGGVYLSKDARRRPTLIAPGGSDPSYSEINRKTVAYEVVRNGVTQIGYRDIGGPERIISSNGGREGNGNSRDPVIGNAGFYVTFESDASNLQTHSSGATNDANRRTDSYLFTDVRDITTAQSVETSGQPLPGGGTNPSPAFYANYIVFDSPAPLGSVRGAHQVFMRYLGGI